MLKEIQRKNVESIIPTKWNIYEWTEKHPDTTIAHAMKRIEKIFDFSDAIYFGFSGGKDSTVTANLACLELNLRRLRVEAGVDRDGNPRIDPLDAKWAVKDENGHYKRRVHGAMTDAEVCFTSTNDYAKRFLAKYGPEGLDLIEFNWICLPLAWQSGVSFDSGILISWDKGKRNMWVQPMPTKDDLHGFECMNEEDLDRANPVLLSSLSLEAQQYHREHGNVIGVPESALFNAKRLFDEPSEVEVEAVANYGRGPALTNLKPGCHEKEEQDEYSYWLSNTTWLVYDGDYEACQKELQKRYDLSKNVWRLTGEPEHGCVTTSLISLRAEESLDRRVILSQGEYSTGQYSRNQGSNVCSPVFDFTTADIWRLLSATDWDVNDIYEKLYEIGVCIGDQRVGSLLNYAAVRQIATVKSLEPDLYGRINARFQNVEFMSQFSRAGYYKIGKPRDTHWDGKNHIKAGMDPDEIAALSDKYGHYLDILGAPYRRDGNEFWTEDPKCKGKPWYPFRDVKGDSVQLTDEQRKKLADLDLIHITWRDYALMLLNSTNEPLRSIWREKVMTSFAHWNMNSGSISEGNLAGLEVLSELPDDFTQMIVDDYYGPDGPFSWYKEGRLSGSKRMKVHVGNYPQESLSNEANLCIKFILNNWNEYGHLVKETPLLDRMWKLAQMSGGKCLLPDEVLTYLLERPLNDSKHGAWIDACLDVFANGIPSQKYAKWWRSEKIEGFPDISDIVFDPSDPQYSGEEKELYIDMLFDEYQSDLPLEEQKANFMNLCDVILKEDVSFSPCFKKICICILKNDVSFKYAGFGATLRERQAREEAIAAFSTKQEEKKKAKAEAEALAKKIEEENKVTSSSIRS